MTLKALELLTSCYILVQGNKVACMGEFKDLKTCFKVVTECMQNVQPIYNIKEIMIKKELQKNPEMQSEDWSRFMPQFKKQNIKRKKVKFERKKKEYTPSPPEQLPRKEDIQMATGEYFLSEKAKDDIKREKKREQKEDLKSAKVNERNRTLAAP
jgi:ribosomal RNA assembly protein